MSPAAARRWVVAGAAAVWVAVWLLWPSSRAAGIAASGTPAAARAGVDRVSRGDGAAAIAAAAPVGLMAAPVEAAVRRVDDLLQHGWLRGTEPDGDWGLWVGEVLQPSRSLRRRFDYLLSGAAEVGLGDLRAWVAERVGREHGAAGAAAVLAVWDGYLGLQQGGAEAAFDIGDEAAWHQALGERTARRRAALGAAWAYAFFAADDIEMSDFVARQARQRQPAAIAPAVATDANSVADPVSLLVPPLQPLTPEQRAERDRQRLAQFGPDATARLQAEDRLQDDWQRRLGQARQSLAAIGSDPQLSAVQREQARETELSRLFSATERVRATALLAIGS